MIMFVNIYLDWLKSKLQSTEVTVDLTYFTFMLPYIVKDFFLNSQPGAPVIQIYSVINLYMFRASCVPIIRSFLQYIRHW